MSSAFEALEQSLETGGTDSLLDTLIKQLREAQAYHELFDALKMKARRDAGLPLLYSESGEDLDEESQKRLEEGLLAACREVGEALLKAERVREGWMYLSHVGDRRTAAELIAAIEPDDENMDEIVEVCLHEGVDVERGYRLVLENYGTCNAITTFESIAGGRSPEEQQAAARLLVRHVHAELTATLRADIGQQEGSEPPEASIADLVAERDWLFGEHSYHLDTTHLASTVRFARLCEDEETLRLALDLTHYGRYLSDQFQYESDEPFASLYPSHALYFQALLGENVDEALQYFREKAETVDVNEWGALAIDAYIDLLARTGRHEQALQAALELRTEEVQANSQGRSLLELSQNAGKYDRFLDQCRGREDVLGFATGLLLRTQQPVSAK